MTCPGNLCGAEATAFYLSPLVVGLVVGPSPDTAPKPELMDKKRENRVASTPRSETAKARGVWKNPVCLVLLNPKGRNAKAH